RGVARGVALRLRNSARRPDARAAADRELTGDQARIQHGCSGNRRRATETRRITIRTRGVAAPTTPYAYSASLAAHKGARYGAAHPSFERVTGDYAMAGGYQVNATEL